MEGAHQCHHTISLPPSMLQGLHLMHECMTCQAPLVFLAIGSRACGRWTICR